MTEKEAIEELKCYRACSGTQLPEEIELAINALEKQIAKKPTDIDNELNTFKCPSCQHTLIALDDMTIHKHCLICGQKLLWD